LDSCGSGQDISADCIHKAQDRTRLIGFMWLRRRYNCWLHS